MAKGKENEDDNWGTELIKDFFSQNGWNQYIFEDVTFRQKEKLKKLETQAVTKGILSIHWDFIALYSDSYMSKCLKTGWFHWCSYYLSHTTCLQTQLSARKPQAHIIPKSTYYWMMTVWQWLSIYYWSYMLPQADEFSVDCIYNILKKFLFIRLVFFFLMFYLHDSIFGLLKLFLL